MNPILVKMDVVAPMPYLHRDAARQYSLLREDVKAGAGFDFLGRAGEMLRPANYVSNKDGVANRSFHKTGRAVDYDQESKALVIVSEIINGKQYFKTYLKCAKQDGSLGKKLRVKDMRGFYVDAFLFDFTAAAEARGFKRIPAWNGWQTHYNRREFWHYQFDQGKTWDEAMLELKDKTRPAAEKVIGLNDRGQDVQFIQAHLCELGLLPPSEVDGVFGAKTKAAVAQFQSKNGLAADGIVGTATRAKLQIK